MREGGAKLYEVACATGPGYILEAVEGAPTAADCVLQSSLAWQLRQENPEAEVGLQCALPGNQNRVEVISGYAQQAAILVATFMAGPVGLFLWIVIREKRARSAGRWK